MLVSTSENQQAAAIIAPILIIVHQRKPIFELWYEFDKNNS